MQPTIHQDVWSPATEDDFKRALAMFVRLPSPPTSSAEFDQQTYFIALRGTTQYGLFKAVEAILQNALGHAFFPSPPELRAQCDKAMEWHVSMRDRIAHREKLEREKPPAWSEPTPEAKARVAALYADFCKSYEKQAEQETFKLDPELVAQVPDNPKSLARQRMGK